MDPLVVLDVERVDGERALERAVAPLGGLLALVVEEDPGGVLLLDALVRQQREPAVGLLCEVERVGVEESGCSYGCQDR
ncbi:hypothetical protein [Frankia sp. CiP3]|uniref:hypothetical protein n=1 Tax=Frankia sp. CiP3 TaxID=2880971 RepID=UPI001EF65D53|nr:hypothetical protein [Frankia sp. CiP3]